MVASIVGSSRSAANGSTLVSSMSRCAKYAVHRRRTNRSQIGPQLAPQRRKFTVFGVELVDEFGCDIATRRSKPRTQALLLIGVMIRCRGVEVLQDVARGASCLGIG